MSGGSAGIHYNCIHRCGCLVTMTSVRTTTELARRFREKAEACESLAAGHLTEKARALLSRTAATYRWLAGELEQRPDLLVLEQRVNPTIRNSRAKS
jgi:hypothetical protein